MRDHNTVMFKDRESQISYCIYESFIIKILCQMFVFFLDWKSNHFHSAFVM